MNKKWFFYWLIVFLLFLCSGGFGAMIFGSGSIILLLDLLIILFALVAIVVGLVIWLVVKRTTFLKRSLVNLILTVLFIFAATLIPTRWLTDIIRGEPKMVAFYEGTQNQAILTLRQNNNFDIWWTGVFGYSEYFKGTYDQDGEKLHFHFKRDPPRKFNGNVELLNERDSSMFVRFLIQDDHDTVERDIYFVVNKTLANN